MSRDDATRGTKMKNTHVLTWCDRSDRTKQFKVEGDMKSISELFDALKNNLNLEITMKRKKQ